jgi:hypothetical protein
MRSNGLGGDVHACRRPRPAVAETLLEDLRAQGVAAYAKPVSRRPPVGSTASSSASASGRLYVDSAASAACAS